MQKWGGRQLTATILTSTMLFIHLVHFWTQHTAQRWAHLRVLSHYLISVLPTGQDSKDQGLGLVRVSPELLHRAAGSSHWHVTIIWNTNHRNKNHVRTDHPISSEKVSIRQILAGSFHILHLTEEVQVVLMKVQAEELSRHVRTLNNQLTRKEKTKGNFSRLFMLL